MTVVGVCGAQAAMQAELAQLLKPEEVHKFAISGREAEFDEALAEKGGRAPTAGLLSVKSKEGRKDANGDGAKGEGKGGKRGERSGQQAQQKKKQKKGSRS